ncbi:toxin-antitoxin system, toxin component, PIN family protein [Saccharothrix sp. NRRL B-16348]|uniref:PIN domain-containing protein n=1 Tax=Saccharothrix sp. NRRL B-16348 TaxID=1415542 RepID=UPI0006AE6DD6|nr:PIN domain-containing protein [Saccharothrix sp. NRRL B-16348]KOX20971.1 toxin-antitoxin system, toxin component, PIN family protein [Saccharothrix sp. NRRL B-16348]
MAFVVVYDACALYGNTVRNLLIRVARARLVQAKWTERILDEVDRSLAVKRGIPEEKRRRLRKLINGSVADCLVEGYESLIDSLVLPDPDDRHVLAAAIRAGAQVIVTANLSDFPADYLGQWDVEAKSPDDFVLDLIGINDRVVYSCVQQIVDERVNPPETIDDVLGQLERSGLIESAAALRLG